VKYKEVILKIEDCIATLTLNRPEKKNALSYRICDEICDAIDEIMNNDEVRVLIITGAGAAFSAGGDLETHPAVTAKDRETRIKHLRHSVRVASKLRSLEIPLIGSINGPALGAGCDIACACDIRIVSEKATFGEIFIRVGFVPDFGGAYFLPRLVGIAKTCELIFTGDPIDAYTAERVGLANKVVPHDCLEAATMELASKLAAFSPFAMKKAKAAIYRAFSTDLDSELKAGAEAQALCLETEYAQQKLRAFVSKRRATSQGE
jgi:enoyl-CoA hydratase/carnithine racemase